ncbi:hypothetical protein MJO52_12865 [Microbulbifer variabilis]|uniref:Endonuclease/exonuclease/phosphatase domain-containing protein n=1 Tax=Microbulbifer variabilis TaxID=266805 RepID=A0ABY4V7R1_9GAMM|nr:hypothetical protein [Microbulbifer variabilis]USD19970.1 hypothetical protein MJO52_12865 [Microbulbifer variabilis]
MALPSVCEEFYFEVFVLGRVKIAVFLFCFLSFLPGGVYAETFKVVSQNIWAGLTKHYDLSVGGGAAAHVNISCETGSTKYNERVKSYLRYLSEVVGEEEDFIFAFQEIDNKSERTCGDGSPLVQRIGDHFLPEVENVFLGLRPMDNYGGVPGEAQDSMSNGEMSGVYVGNAIITRPKIRETMYKVLRKGLSDDQKTSRGYVTTLLEFESEKQLWFVNIHATHGDASLAVADVKQMLIDMKEAYQREPRPIIFSGDFNIRSGTSHYDDLIELFDEYFDGTVEATQKIEYTYMKRSEGSGSGGHVMVDGSKLDYIFYYSPNGLIKQKILPVNAPNGYPFPLLSAEAKDALCVGSECFPDHKLIYAEFYWP